MTQSKYFNFIVREKQTEGFIFKDYFVLLELENSGVKWNFRMLVNEKDFKNNFWIGRKGSMKFIQLKNGNWIPSHYQDHFEGQF